MICLHGDVGMGKSVFSRAFVRAVARDPHLEVPSPTYLLQQIYDEHDPSSGPPVHHFDLYRLSESADKSKLGLDESFATAASLLEWAERLGDLAPSVRLDVYISAWASGEGDVGAEAAAAGATMVTGDARCDDDDDVRDHGGEEDGDGDDEGDVDPAFVDRQPRLFRLEPRGAEWCRRVDAMMSSL